MGHHHSYHYLNRCEKDIEKQLWSILLWPCGQL